MKLKTLLFVCCISFLSSSLSAQKCKYNFDKLDKMTNERVRRITFAIKNYFQVSLFRKADDFRVELNVRFIGERNFQVKTGETIDIKLSGGTILNLKAFQDASPVSYAASGQIMTIYAITYSISKEEMQQIAKEGFKVVKAKLGGEEYTFETSEKMTLKTAAGATCILTP